MTVQVSEINPQTSQRAVKGSVPAKFVEMTCGQVQIDSFDHKLSFNKSILRTIV